MSSVPKQSDIRVKSIDVVVVEDDPDVRRLLETVLTMAELLVRSFDRADTAYDAIHARIPDVVVTDLRLDGGSAGWTLAEALRGDARTSDIALIAVTGTVAPARAVVAPFDAYLTKPVDMGLLRELVTHLAAARRAARSQKRARG